jgi:hypothetical protein
MLGKTWHHSAASNYLYLFVWQWRAASLLYFVKPSFCNSARSELKCKAGMKEPMYHGILSNKDSWCLVPFSSNISCDHPQSFSFLAKRRTRVPYISQWYYIVIFQLGTQQENCSTKHSFTRCSCDCSTLQGEWGFIPRNIELLLLLTALNCYMYLWREWKAYCCIAKQGTYEASHSATPIHEVHRFLIGKSGQSVNLTTKHNLMWS